MHTKMARYVGIAVINLKLVYLYITIFTSLIAMLYGLPIGTTVYQLLIPVTYNIGFLFCLEEL